MTISIVQTAFLGDVLLTLPLCAAIRRHLPHARIVFITTPAAADFIDGLDYADDVVAFDKRGEHRTGKGLRGLIAERCSGVDLALVPHASFRTMRFAKAMRPKNLVTFNNTWTRWLPGAISVKYPRAMHDADRHLQLLDASLRILELSGSSDLALSLTKEDVGPLRLFTETDRLDPGSKPYVVLAPGTVWPTKQWPLEYVNALAARLANEGQHVVVIGDKSVAGVVAPHPNVVDLAGRTSFRQAAAVVAGASIVVANDSAPLHVASLQGIPVIGVFGPTVREFGFGPYGPHARLIERTDLACRPCTNHGSVQCPIRTHVCMRSIGAEQVYDNMVSLSIEVQSRS